MYTEKREVLTKEKCKREHIPSRGVMIAGCVAYVLIAAMCIGLAIVVGSYFRSYFAGKVAEEIDGLDAIWGALILLCLLAFVAGAGFMIYYMITKIILDTRKLRKGNFLIVEDELIRVTLEYSKYKSAYNDRYSEDHVAYFAKTGRYLCPKSFYDRFSEGDKFYVLVLEGEYIEAYAAYSKQTYVCYEVDDLYGYKNAP